MLFPPEFDLHTINTSAWNLEERDSIVKVQLSLFLIFEAVSTLCSGFWCMDFVFSCHIPAYVNIILPPPPFVFALFISSLKNHTLLRFQSRSQFVSYFHWTSAWFSAQIQDDRPSKGFNIQMGITLELSNILMPSDYWNTLYIVGTDSSNSVYSSIFYQIRPTSMLPLLLTYDLELWGT